REITQKLEESRHEYDKTTHQCNSFVENSFHGLFTLAAKERRDSDFPSKNHDVSFSSCPIPTNPSVLMGDMSKQLKVQFSLSKICPSILSKSTWLLSRTSMCWLVSKNLTLLGCEIPS